MKLLRNLVVVCAAVLLASAAMAQGGGRGQGGFRMMGGGDSSGLMLLQRADVQRELKITDDQKSKLDAARQKMMEDMRAQFQGGGGPPDREQMQKTMAKMMEDMKKQAEGILSKEQMARLREINIQLAGNNAATWADIQKEIGITDDQKAKIKDLQSKQQEANQGLFQKMRDQEITREELQDAMKKNTDAFNVELGKILTADQKAKLKTMGGKEFKPDKDGGL